MAINIQYEIILYWSNADQAFIAEVPELPGCAADGATYQEALANVEIVIREWIEKRGDLQWVEPAGGTVCMIKLPPNLDAQALCTMLQEKYGTLVVPGEFFYVRGFIRVSAGMDEDVLRQGLRNIGKAIDQLQSDRA